MKQKKIIGELKMKPAEFDRLMRGALGSPISGKNDVAILSKKQYGKAGKK